MTEGFEQRDLALGHSAARGAAQLLSGQAARFMVQLASVAILARLITPGDYGLYAMVLAVLGIGHIFRDFGLSTAAIQAPVLTRAQRDNLFWLNAGLGLALMLASMALSPVLAGFFGRPEIVGIAMVLSITFFISGMTTQYRADLSRRLRFGAQALAETVSTFVGLGAGVVVALGGGGYWALVAQQVVGGAIALIMMSMYSRWLPRGYDRNAPMRSLFDLGIPILVTQIVSYISSNADAVIMGRLYGPIPVGLYNRAMQVVRVPMNQLRGPLGGLSLSVLSRVQDDDRQLLRFVQRGQLVMSYPLLLVTGIFVAAASPLIELFLGPGWEQVVPYLQLIAVGEGLNTLAAVGGWIYTSRGLGRAFLNYTYVSAGFRLLLIGIAAVFGPLWIAAAFAVAPILLWPLSLIWVGRVAGLRMGNLIKSSYRIVAVCALACGSGVLCAQFVINFPALVEVVFIASAVLVAAAVLSALPRVREDYRDVWRAVAMVGHAAP